MRCRPVSRCGMAGVNVPAAVTRSPSDRVLMGRRGGAYSRTLLVKIREATQAYPFWARFRLAAVGADLSNAPRTRAGRLGRGWPEGSADARRLGVLPGDRASELCTP